jgi:hypothetical protein
LASAIEVDAPWWVVPLSINGNSYEVAVGGYLPADDGIGMVRRMAQTEMEIVRRHRAS